MIFWILLYTLAFCVIIAFNIGLLYLNRWSNRRLESLYRRRA